MAHRRIQLKIVLTPVVDFFSKILLLCHAAELSFETIISRKYRFARPMPTRHFPHIPQISLERNTASVVAAAGARVPGANMRGAFCRPSSFAICF